MTLYNTNLDIAKEMFNNAKSIGLIGHGGNLAICQHMASDIARHTGKFCVTANAIEITALQTDNPDVPWQQQWIDHCYNNIDLFIGVTCRLNNDIVKSLNTLSDRSKVLLIAPKKHDNIHTITLDQCRNYHEFEVNALWTIYMLMESIGVQLPELP